LIHLNRETQCLPNKYSSSTGGVNVLVEGLMMSRLAGEQVSPGVIDLSADRVVVWTQAGEGPALEGGSQVLQPSESKLQIYMEGNIVIRQKKNVIHATHAFFDANSNRALMLNAELRAFLPTTQGDFRIRAKRMRMMSQDRFHAQNAWATTSPYGEPGYRIEASDIFVAPVLRCFQVPILLPVSR
jgi:lipopolysaccharide assembly outer membrane protein LptD (OstA)